MKRGMEPFLVLNRTISSKTNILHKENNVFIIVTNGQILNTCHFHLLMMILINAMQVVKIKHLMLFICFLSEWRRAHLHIQESRVSSYIQYILRREEICFKEIKTLKYVILI